MELNKELRQIDIRELRKEDLQQVYLINKENFTTDAWTMEGFERELSLDYSRSYIMEIDNQIIGYAIVWTVYDEANIMTFAIKKEFWGKGLGKYLLSKVIQDIKPAVSRILLDVRVSNIRAINLYKSAGFKVLNVRYKYYSDGENAYQMCLELKDEDKGTEA